EGSIAIRPLTILAGANSSGKSSIMQPLLLMKQTQETDTNYGALRLKGEHVAFDSFNTLLSLPMGEQRSFGVQLEFNGEEQLSLEYGYRDNETIIIMSEYIGENAHIRLYPNMSHEEIQPQFPFDFKPFLDSIANISRLDIYPRLKVTRYKCFLNIGVESVMPDGSLFENMTFNDTSLLNYPVTEFKTYTLYFFHLPALRSKAQRSYPNTSIEDRNFLGPFEDYIASILHEWTNHPDTSPLATLIAWLTRLGIAKAIKTQFKYDVEIEILISRSLNQDDDQLVNIADVGVGVSQVLPILVALLIAEPGQLVYIEQPELHLHPRAQHQLAEFLAEAAKRGVRVVIETHSDILLLGIQTQVAKQAIAPDQVILHWFERDQDGMSKITTRELDAEGAYGDWPEDFSMVKMEADSDYLDVVDQHHFAREETPHDG
ncbi:MAG: AAA family ATPase, partial [Anaerolineae bacterium]|nr:AAA family ATPase [Anaerolineae bacterium]